MLQGYNCQAAVVGYHQVIVAMGVSNQPPDVEHLEPMLELTIANTGACPETFITVDAGFCEAVAGYWIENNVNTCEKRGAAPPHISTGRQKHGQPPPAICVWPHPQRAGSMPFWLYMLSPPGQNLCLGWRISSAGPMAGRCGSWSWLTPAVPAGC
jgi:hypothetical protein